MKCKNCNKEILETWSLCPFCGQALVWAKIPGTESSSPIVTLPETARKFAAKAQKIKLNEKGYVEAEFLDGIILIYVPEGEFIMGKPEIERPIYPWDIDWRVQNDCWVMKTKEYPVHRIFLDGYWIGKTPVTFSQIDMCSDLPRMKDEGWGRGQRPVINISWDKAILYCKWLTRKIGVSFRLPTESEWEKAARGIDGRRYPWGYEPPDDKVANFSEANILKTTEVGGFPNGASPFGCLDMAGNVSEWCQDWWDEKNELTQSTTRNPTGPSRGASRVIRGGSWASMKFDMACTSRTGQKPGDYNERTGFRLASSLVGV